MKFIDITQQQISSTMQIIFVADLFVEDYCGGAELTSEALINSSQYKVFKLHSKDVTQQLIKQHQNKLWIFGNFSAINPDLLGLISNCCKYQCLEYDYKFCSYRSPDKHQFETGNDCDCATQPIGILVSRFFANASKVWFMSQAQRHVYIGKFPQLARNSDVLSSVFDEKTLNKIKKLRECERN